jgi:hypothetical protein
MEERRSAASLASGVGATAESLMHADKSRLEMKANGTIPDARKRYRTRERLYTT